MWSLRPGTIESESCLHRGAGACRRAFTLIELLVVIGVVTILGSLLVPALGQARLSARIARAHVELRQITVALELYRDRWNVFPPARTYCTAQMSQIDDYNHLPPELVAGGYLDSLPEDLFNPGRTYKYIAPGIGWANNAMTYLSIRVPNTFSVDEGGTTPYFEQDASPVKCAIWSVGPGEAPSVFESDSQHFPLPPRHWYPHRRDGILVHYYRDGTWRSSLQEPR